MHKTRKSGFNLFEDEPSFFFLSFRTKFKSGNDHCFAVFFLICSDVRAVVAEAAQAEDRDAANYNDHLRAS